MLHKICGTLKPNILAHILPYMLSVCVCVFISSVKKFVSVCLLVGSLAIFGYFQAINESGL